MRRSLVKQGPALVLEGGRYPTPMATLAPENDAGLSRMIWCRHYDFCLNAVEKSNWPGWTCCNCLVADEFSWLEKMDRLSRIYRDEVRRALQGTKE